MLTAGALLIFLSVFTVHGVDAHVDHKYAVEIPTNLPKTDIIDWFMDLMDDNICDHNPCFNGGSCQTESPTFLMFICLCPEPYTGRRCQKIKNVCEGITCGFGDCVANPKIPPFYECKCRPPYQGPDCKSLPESCVHSPCQNGGSCVEEIYSFRCTCPDGYTGKFCENALNDCYVGNGETYRGTVNVTKEGDECLDWHSEDLTASSDYPLLEYNNYCRNPDGDQKPWCFFKKGNNVEWSFCKVKACSEVPTPPPPTTAPAQFSQCGKPQPSIIGRIFGGTKSVPGAHPWQASVQIRPNGSSLDFKHWCGGTLLNSCWVLTAAHCIEPESDFQVVLGGVNIDKQEESDQTIPVIQIIVHENYLQTPLALSNDIALLQLKVTNGIYCANETRFVKSACLPDQPFPAKKECVVSGWGATENQRKSSQLLSAHIFLISQERCRMPRVYGNMLDSSMLCAGTMAGGIDSCKGDSGGPLVCEKDGTHYVTGVVSWGRGCALRNKPGVYADVYTFLNWITSKMN